MAQARVTEYFAAKKKRRGEQPSKRRKVDFTETEPSITQLKGGPVTLKPCGIESGSNVIQQNGVTSKQQQRPAVKLSTVPNVRRSARSTVSRPEKSTRSSTRQSSRLQNPQKGTIPELLESISIKSKVHESDENRGFVDQASSKKIYAETTDCWDEHDGFSSNQEDSCCNTPQKASTLKRNARKRKKDQRMFSAQVLQLQSTPSQKNSPLNSKKTPIPKSETAAKKKLDLNLQNQDENEGSPTDEQLQQASKEKLMNMAAAMSPPKAISPLPGTPQKTRASRRKKAAEPSSEKILAAIEQCKSLAQKTSKKPPLIDAATVKARLAKCGKLEELKAQLAQMNAAKAKSKPKKAKAKPAVPEKVESPKLQKFEVLDVEVEETTKEEVKVVPAYERYHHLATPGTPTLSLPYKYRMLAEMFRGMDTVVSMLHNRSEIITFSKLKAAVQTMNKRNFEKSNAGQIKTVFPTGFTFRQEKGLPCYGGKTSGYQLTVEPNLEAHINKDAGDGVKRESNSRVTFTATHLLHRRGFFHHRLIDIVKRYHREFLSKLSKPLSIPDDKITRWHPQFKLDEVPDVDTSPLPEPPYEKKYHTAKDVLEATRGKTLPRVEKALENVAKQSELTSPSKPSQSVTSSPKPAVKGVPQSLLEKIRAKEAAKLATSLTRNPAEEKKILMMSRLPDMMRIVRNYFVTEKKSSLPMGNVVQKLQDSYRMSIALSDIETHVNLMVELAPEWMSLQQIRKGKYIKLNIAVELQQLQDRINGLIKQRT